MQVGDAARESSSAVLQRILPGIVSFPFVHSHHHPHTLPHMAGRERGCERELEREKLPVNGGRMLASVPSDTYNLRRGSEAVRRGGGGGDAGELYTPCVTESSGENVRGCKSSSIGRGEWRGGTLGVKERVSSAAQMRLSDMIEHAAAHERRLSAQGRMDDTRE